MIKSKHLDSARFNRVMAAFGLFVGGLALWSGLMIRQTLWIGGLGPICGHRGLLFTVHCPGCYLAAAMMIGALVLAAATVGRPRSVGVRRSS